MHDFKIPCPLDYYGQEIYKCQQYGFRNVKNTIFTTSSRMADDATLVICFHISFSFLHLQALGKKIFEYSINMI